MHNEPIEDIQQARNQLAAHFTPDLQLLLDAIDELLQMDWAKESIVIRSAHSFYVNTLFGPFVETQKAAGLQRLKDRCEQERIKREEEEQIRLAELERQNKIRTQQTSVLNKFQEIGNIEIACQEAGIEFHIFNIWLEEDSTFASSYNEIVHRMEVRKYEEAERKRKAQVIEAETKQKKSQFKILFEQNKCDLLKTCSEVGISSANYQEWRRMDSVFNDEMNYIIRENEKIINQQYRQKRAKILKKIGIISSVVILVVIIALGTKVIIDNKKITKQHQLLINDFNVAYEMVKSESSKPNVEKFDASLVNLKKSLDVIHRFELSNTSISEPKYDSLKKEVISLSKELPLLIIDSYTEDPSYIQNKTQWDKMEDKAKSFKI